MLRNEKGVTMAMLIITVIVMVVVASIAMTAGSNLRKKTELADRVSQMQLIQAKAEEIYNEHLYKGSKLIGQEVTLNEGDEIRNEKWYKLSSEDMKSMGIDFTPTDEYYYCVKYDLTEENSEEGVDKEEIDPIDVYYSGGYESTNGNMYYTLGKLKDLES